MFGFEHPDHMKGEAMDDVIHQLHQEKEEAKEEAAVYVGEKIDTSKLSWEHLREQIWREINLRLPAEVRRRFKNEYGLNEMDENYAEIMQNSEEAYKYVFKRVQTNITIVRVQDEIQNYEGGLDVPLAILVEKYITAFYSVMVRRFQHLMRQQDEATNVYMFGPNAGILPNIQSLHMHEQPQSMPDLESGEEDFNDVDD